VLYVPGFRQAAVAMCRGTRFPGYEHRSSPYPPTPAFRCSATRLRIVLLASPICFGPFMLELFTACLFKSAGRRSCQTAGTHVTVSTLHTPASVARWLSPPCPAEGFSPIQYCRPRRAGTTQHPRSVSVAPLPLEGHRIELEDYSSFEVLLSRASVEPDKRLSSHPARRDSPVTVGKTVPLAKLIRPGLAGWATHK